MVGLEPLPGRAEPAVTVDIASLELSPAPWSRRLLCMVYETLIVAALLLSGSLVALVWLPADAASAGGGWARLSLQAWLLLLLTAYFAGCWSRYGQTLAMKTWRLLITDAAGQRPSPGRALLRLALAATTLPLSLLWPALDRDRLFLHDRLAGTRIWRIT